MGKPFRIDPSHYCEKVSHRLFEVLTNHPGSSCRLGNSVSLTELTDSYVRYPKSFRYFGGRESLHQRTHGVNIRPLNLACLRFTDEVRARTAQTGRIVLRARSSAAAAGRTLFTKTLPCISRRLAVTVGTQPAKVLYPVIVPDSVLVVQLKTDWLTVVGVGNTALATEVWNQTFLKHYPPRRASVMLGIFNQNI